MYMWMKRSLLMICMQLEKPVKHKSMHTLAGSLMMFYHTLPPSADVYGLEWKETTDSNGSCTFLGMKIRKWSNGMLRLSVFDKAAEWNFHVIRYPSKQSNIPIHQPAGIFTGQVTRFWHICNNIPDFKHAVTQLALRLLLRGHHTSTLMRGWNKYVQRHHRRSTAISIKVTHWFKRMVKWALRHPLPDPASINPTSTTHDGAEHADVAHASATPASVAPSLAPPSNRYIAAEPSAPDLEHACPKDLSHVCTTPQPVRTRTHKRPRITAHHDDPSASPRACKRPRRDLMTNMCGLHALNSCLHAYSLPTYTANALVCVATDLDDREKVMILEWADNPRLLRAFRRIHGTNRNSAGFTLLEAFNRRDLQFSRHHNPLWIELPLTCKAILVISPNLNH